MNNGDARAMPDRRRGTGPEAPLLRVRNLKTYFPIRQGTLVRRVVGHIKAVDEVSFDIGRGETLGMVGESGCGKSTVGHSIVRLVRPTAGSINFDGIELTRLDKRSMRRLYRRVQMIYQDVFGSLDPRMSVGDIIAEPMVIHGIGDRPARRRRVRELLDLVALRAQMADVYPHEMSGGQRQRVGIARALALQPDLIICDEPISALDVSIQAQIINLLRHLQDAFGLTYLFIAHDLAVIHHVADRIVVMYLGKVVEIAASDTLVTAPRHPYTQALLAAVPIPDPVAEAARGADRVILGGDLPSPFDPPVGCNFCTRCPATGRVMEAHDIDCGTEEPRLQEVAPGHWAACHLYAACRPR